MSLMVKSHLYKGEILFFKNHRRTLFVIRPWPFTCSWPHNCNPHSQWCQIIADRRRPQDDTRKRLWREASSSPVSRVPNPYPLPSVGQWRWQVRQWIGQSRLDKVMRSIWREGNRPWILDDQTICREPQWYDDHRSNDARGQRDR